MGGKQKNNSGLVCCTAVINTQYWTRPVRWSRSWLRTKVAWVRSSTDHTHAAWFGDAAHKSFAASGPSGGVLRIAAPLDALCWSIRGDVVVTGDVTACCRILDLTCCSGNRTCLHALTLRIHAGTAVGRQILRRRRRFRATVFTPDGSQVICTVERPYFLINVSISPQF